MSDDIPEAAKSLVSDLPKRHPATAHFPIEGATTTCRSCANFLKGRRRIGRCVKWAEFRGLAFRLDADYRAEHKDWWRGMPTIGRDTPACKYFAP